MTDPLNIKIPSIRMNSVWIPKFQIFQLSHFREHQFCCQQSIEHKIFISLILTITLKTGYFQFQENKLFCFIHGSWFSVPQKFDKFLTFIDLHC